MTRYYFDTFDGTLYVQDTDGLDLPSEEDARKIASRELGEMAHDTLPEDSLSAFSVTVRDTDDRPIFHGTMTVFAQWLNHR